MEGPPYEFHRSLGITLVRLITVVRTMVLIRLSTRVIMSPMRYSAEILISLLNRRSILTNILDTTNPKLSNIAWETLPMRLEGFLPSVYLLTPRFLFHTRSKRSHLLSSHHVEHSATMPAIWLTSTVSVVFLSPRFFTLTLYVCDLLRTHYKMAASRPTYRMSSRANCI